MTSKEYYIVINNKQEGPFSLEELGNQGIERNSRIFKLGASDFANAEDLPEIKEYYFSAKRPAQPKPETIKPQPTPSPVNMEAVSEAARREREMRKQQEAARQQAQPPVTPAVPDFGGPVVPPVMTPEEKPEWFLQQGSNRFGPITLTELKGHGLDEKSYVWRDGMPDWLLATSVPELSSFVSPAAPVMPQVPPMTTTAVPAIPVTDSVPSTPIYDDQSEAEDVSAYGNPMALPLTGLVISLLFILFALYTVFGTSLNDDLYYIYSCTNSVDSYSVSHAHNFDFYDDHLYIMMGISFLPAIILSIAGLTNASSAKKLYMSDDIRKACKKSGSATAFGWGATIYSAFAIFICIFIVVYASLA